MKKKTKWEFGVNDVGQSELRWNVGREAMDREEADPLAQTYNFLKRLDVAALTLEEEKPRRREEYDPYNTGIHAAPDWRRLLDET